MGNALAENIVWNLGDLYRSPSDPQIDADTKLLREKVSAFSSFRGKVAGLGPQDLLQAVRGLEEINELAQKLQAYAYLNFSTQTQDAAASALSSIPEGTLQSKSAGIPSFSNSNGPSWKTASARSVASDPALSKYRHYLELSGATSRIF